MIPLVVYAAAALLGTSTGVLYVNAERIFRNAGEAVINGVVASMAEVMVNDVENFVDKSVVESKPTKEVVEKVLIKPEDVSVAKTVEPE